MANSYPTGFPRELKRGFSGVSGHLFPQRHFFGVGRA
jgi:hypothetical protein